MNKEHYKILMTEYLNGDIQPEQEAALKAYLEQNETGKSELFELKVLNDQLGQVQVPEPSEQMSANFYTMLETHKQEEKNKHSLGAMLKNWWTNLNYHRFAYNLSYGIVGILVGALGMYYFSQSPNNSQSKANKNIGSLAVIQKKLNKMEEDQKRLISSLLEKKSASERLRAVNLTSNISVVDSKITKALLKTLNSDPNVNVRLTTVEVLGQFAARPEVRTGLIKSIAKQESPLVQIALIDVMVELQEKNSVKALKDLLKKQDLNEAVKGKAEQGIQILL
ncbi:HEAT repeat domain-containing protein [uncultured Microscilla sp.]|uniref:HEAT repeat domain-containing protein n=1 Tax=uncultured Microscilla sp. TaxID=432653 RepID=UPI002637D228|nr:HEAT repeat domain-containing protein [uncultured Microscilla sp.]